MIPRWQTSRVGAISYPLAQLNLSRDLLCIIANIAELVFGNAMTGLRCLSLYNQILGWVRSHSKEESSVQRGLLIV